MELTVTDGAECKSFSDERRISGRLFPATGCRETEVRLSNLLVAARPGPVFLFYRPFEPELQKRMYDLRTYSISSEPAEIEGHRCVVLSQPATDIQPFTLWLDVERDFAPLRVKVMTKGHPASQYDLWYVADPAFGWSLSRWRCVYYTDPLPSGQVNLARQYDCEVMSSEINLEIPRSEFQFTFPKGTLFTDRRTQRSHIIGVGPDGKDRQVTQEEFVSRVPYERLLETEPGLGVQPRGWFASRWSLLILLALGVAVTWTAVSVLRHRRAS